MTTERILLVDDDVNALAGFRRQLRARFTCETAESGAQGLEIIAKSEPFAVVMSDMRMPGMDGISFLAQVELHAPETVRIMLTGNADIETCIDAVNQGHVFRFLTKPCEPDLMAKAFDAGIAQYRLIRAQRELLHGTVAGCIRTLADILAVVNPAAFSRSTRVRRYVRHIAAQLNSPHLWEYEMAAALCQIGCVALSPEILARITTGRPLTNEQRSILANHPMVGCQLLAEIPRLKLVALIIGKQRTPPHNPVMPHEHMSDDEVVDLGAQILRVALDLDVLTSHGETFIQALASLHERYGNDHPLVDSLMSYEKDAEDKTVVRVTAGELTPHMATAMEIKDAQGRQLLPKGHRLSGPMVHYLQGCVQAKEVTDSFLVEILSPAE